MIIKAYGVELERLKHQDIELLRQMRNADHVKRYMEYREEITPEAQEKWFASINNINNFYYIIKTSGKKVGLINAAKIDWEKMETYSGGIFIWDEQHIDSLVPVAASILLTDTSVILGFKKSHAKILRTNERAISYNKMMGYQLVPGQEEKQNMDYVVTTRDYFEKTSALRKTLTQKHGPQIEFIIDDPDHPVTQFILEKLQNATGPLREHCVFTH